jgi:hypothetical protein
LTLRGYRFFAGKDWLVFFLLDFLFLGSLLCFKRSLSRKSCCVGHPDFCFSKKKGHRSGPVLLLAT